jgi:protein tyrosine phosphatase (PTP) superfamily phosphohydrolase (DUF442 family)
VAAPDPLSVLSHYRRISNKIATAGQPTSDQFQAIAAEGFEVVINLGLQDADYALPDEQALVESLGLIYESIPVLWQEPTQQNFEQFVDCIHRHEGEKQFIHCAANNRVSVFVALFQILEQGLPADHVLNELEEVWTPNQVWQSFINQSLKRRGINAKD